MSGYFSKFPAVMYGNALATNIMARIKLDSSVRNSSTVFHSYVLKEGERPDTIAEHYYGDPYFAWLIYYANEIIDPYFEWPMNQRDFESFIVNKYGSSTAAYEKILFYKVNWETDENMIQPGAYDSLPARLKKYWVPVISHRGNIVSYERSQLDLTVETNQIVQLTVSDGTIFTLEEQVKQINGSTVEASGFVKYNSGTSVVVEKIEGEFSTSYPLINFSNTVNTSVSSVSLIKQCIPEEEVIYWSPVYAYNYENELNESRKQIQLIDASYIDKIELEMKSLLT